MDELRTTIIGILQGIAPEGDYESLGDEDDLREALELDSFDLLQFMEGLSVRTGVEVPDEDAQQVITVGGAFRYVRDRAPV